MKTRYIALALIYLACSVIAYGIFLADLTDKFGEQRNAGGAVACSMFGPVSLGIALFASNQDSIRRPMFRPLTPDQQWLVYHHKYPSLPRCRMEGSCGAGMHDRQKVRELEKGAAK